MRTNEIYENDQNFLWTKTILFYSTNDFPERSFTGKTNDWWKINDCEKIRKCNERTKWKKRRTRKSSHFSAYLGILHYCTRMEVIIFRAPVCTYSHSWLQVLHSFRGYLQDLKEQNELYSGNRTNRNECCLPFCSKMSQRIF